MALDRGCTGVADVSLQEALLPVPQADMAAATQAFHVVPHARHAELISAAYRFRGFTAEEAADAAKFCDLASTHGIRTHNGIKALHLDDHFGSRAGGCVPGAVIEEIPSRFPASKVW